MAATTQCICDSPPPHLVFLILYQTTSQLIALFSGIHERIQGLKAGHFPIVSPWESYLTSFQLTTSSRK